jgi:hypothetical protein
MVNNIHHFAKRREYGNHKMEDASLTKYQNKANINQWKLKILFS